MPYFETIVWFLFFNFNGFCRHKIDTKIQISTNDLTNKYWILKEHDRTESEVKKLFEGPIAFRDTTFWKALLFLKIATKWREIQKSKLNNFLAKWAFRKIF